MLYSIDDLIIPITDIPHKKEYNLWKSRLNQAQYDSIIHELNNRINGTEVQTSSWIPGDKWSATVFDLIYTKACNLDFDQSGLFLGLLVWDKFMQRPETWSFGRYKKDGFDIKDITYFRIYP